MAVWGEVELFCRAILQEGEAEAARLLAAARAQAEPWQQEAVAAAERRLATELAAQRARLAAEAKKKQDAAEVAAKRRLWAFREEIFQQAQQDLANRWAAFRQQSAYVDFLARAIAEGLEQLATDDIIVEVHPSDRDAVAAALAQLPTPPDHCEVVTSPDVIRGVRLYTRDRHRLYDNTMAARWQRLEPELRRLVWRTIFGD